MTKGKHAALSASRKYETAMAHIDRLTDQLTEAKGRARDAEATAARLEGADRLLQSTIASNDAMLQEALETIKRWKRVQKEDQDRRMAAYQELIQRVIPDVGMDISSRSTRLDRFKFLQKRYPAILRAIMADDKADQKFAYDTCSPLRPLERKLGRDELARFQRLSGQVSLRADTLTEMSEVWADLLDAKQAEFTPDEIKELLGVAR